LKEGGEVTDIIDELASGDARTRASLRHLAAARVDEWLLLVGHPVGDGRQISDLSLRVQYLHLTDRLVNTVVEGHFDRVIFLDKSARPVCWLMRLAWPVLSPTIDGGRASPTPVMPLCSFLNIDRLQWRSIMDPSGTGMFDADQIPEEPIIGLRDAFRPHDSSAFTWVDGQRVLVVDEVRVSGDTAAIAASILGRSFPNAHFVPSQWMTPRLVTRSGGNRYNNQLPVWYRDDTHLGRGIGDRDPEWSLQHRSKRIRAAAWFLSRPLSGQDPGSVQLRRELAALVGGLLRREWPLVPDFDRADLESRCRLFNGVDLAELRKYRERHQILLDV